MNKSYRSDCRPVTLVCVSNIWKYFRVFWYSLCRKSLKFVLLETWVTVLWCCGAVTKLEDLKYLLTQFQSSFRADSFSFVLPFLWFKLNLRPSFGLPSYSSSLVVLQQQTAVPAISVLDLVCSSCWWCVSCPAHSAVYWAAQQFVSLHLTVVVPWGCGLGGGSAVLWLDVGCWESCPLSAQNTCVTVDFSLEFWAAHRTCMAKCIIEHFQTLAWI